MSTVSQADALASCTSTPTAASVPIVTSVPAPTYAAGSQNLAAFNYLNNARSSCGFGLLAQNANLDVSATAHTNYLFLNRASGHSETAGLAGYTGDDPFIRIAAAGYVGAGNEFASVYYRLGGPGLDMSSITAIDHTRTLLAAPYHLRSMVYGWRDLGVAYRADTESTVIAGNPGTRSGELYQQPVASEVLSYPCGNTTDAAMFLAGESPWPWPAHTGPIGQPIHLQVREGQELVITTATITHTAGPGIDVGTAANGAVAGATSMLQKLDWNNDTNNRFTGRKNVASLMPEKTMYPGSTYRVQITGTNGGTTFSKDFSFITTGGADYSACLATIPGRINATSYWDAARKANALSNVPYFCAGHIYGYSVSYGKPIDQDYTKTDVREIKTTIF